MTPSIPPAASLTQLAVELATGAGSLIRRHRSERFSISTKSTPTDVVTDIDRQAESYIRTELARLRPADAVLGEEEGRADGSSGVRWVIDPIDGTVNFVLGLPQYAVSIAAEVGGRIVGGCVHNPASGELFHATRGEGAFAGDERLSGPRDVPLARAVVGTGFAYDASVRARQGAIVAQLLPRVGDIRRIGSAALDLCAVASGRLDAYFEVGLNPWDWAAGVLIAEEAGCTAFGLRGRPPSATMTAVAAPALSGDFRALLEELGADAI